MNQPKEKKSAEILNILARSRALLEFHQDLDLSYPPASSTRKFLAATAPSLCPAPTAVPRRAEIKIVGESGRPAIPLGDIHQEIKDCRRCRLAQNREGILPGRGNGRAGLFIVAEQPTPEDVETGRLLSGAAGEMLSRMLAAIKLSDNDAYLTTIIKCCPPAGSTPAPAEINSCLPFITSQISAVRPRVIYTLGPTTAQAMLNTNEPLIRLRGRFHQFNTTPLLPSFHPLFLLKNPEMKKAAWHDLQMIEGRLRA